MPHFAISVPVGAWHPFLPHVLKSLKMQGERVSVAFLDASGDPRVKALADENREWLAYRRHGKDKGQSDAILEGWANVESDWLGWLNADDLLMPGAIERVVAAIKEEPSLDVVYGQSVIIDEASAMTGYHFNVEPPGPRLMEGCIISQPSCFFRRSTYDSVGGLNRDLHYVMDWDLWIRLYKVGSRFKFIDVLMSQVLWGNETKSASLNKRRRLELKAIINEHTPEAKKKEIFRAFAIHAIADMIWPAALKDRVLKHLRRVGQRLYGLRADGEIEEQAHFCLAHYFEHDVGGVTFDFEGMQPDVKSSLPSRQIAERDGTTSLVFDRPIVAGQALEVTVTKPGGTEPLYFKRVAWRPCEG